MNLNEPIRRVIPIRASSMPELFDCAARWEAKNIRGLRMPKSGKAQLGTAIHKSTSLFDQSHLDGIDLRADECAGALVDSLNQPDEDVRWDDDLGASDAEKIGRALHSRYCAEIAPKQDYAAVEVRCESLEITDLGIALTGTTDRIRRVDDGFGIVDLKTGKTAVTASGHVETAGHAMQLGVYELMAERASGLAVTAPARIVGLQTGKTARGQRVAESADIHGARDMLVGDQNELGILEIAAQMIHSSTFPGNPNSMLCHERYCPIFNSCRFRK